MESLIKDQFFVLDSNTLAQSETHLYGFCISHEHLIENHTLNIQSDFSPTGLGGYIYLERKGKKLTIYQDFMGCYGLYLFQMDGYFAISNSFLYLVEYLKPRYPMTFNQVYADCFLLSELCSITYENTMVQEIRMLDRSAKVEIDVESCNFAISMIDYEENSILLDSPEGMALLDAWFDRWVKILRSVQIETSNIVTDLSGGFDSRMTFMLLTKSCTSSADMAIYSNEGKLHTYVEDYEIASEIAAHYGYLLNSMSGLNTNYKFISMDDSIAASFYIKLCFHKSMEFPVVYHTKRMYKLTGSGGECIRTYLHNPPQQYRRFMAGKACEYPWKTALHMMESVRQTLDHNFSKAAEKYHIDDLDSPDLVSANYRQVRCVMHFGKAVAEAYMGNCIQLTPLMDPDLHRIRLTDSRCSDMNLLTALIYVRYCPDMLNFRFEGKRSIDEGTIQYAREINNRYPRKENAVTEATAFGGKERPIAFNEVGQRLTHDMVKDHLKKVFFSNSFRQAFERRFDPYVGEFTWKDVATRAFGQLSQAYTAMGIVKIAHETQEIRGLGGYFASFLDTVVDEEQMKISQPPRIRMDIISVTPEGSNVSNDIHWIDIDDPRATLKSPQWWKNNIGYLIQSNAGSLNLVFRCTQTGKGRLRIVLLERDLQPDTKIDFVRLLINNEERIQEPRIVTREKAAEYWLDVEDQQMITITVAWKAHEEKVIHSDEIMGL